MKRRTFLKGVAGAAAVPLVGWSPKAPPVLPPAAREVGFVATFDGLDWAITRYYDEKIIEHLSEKGGKSPCR